MVDYYIYGYFKDINPDGVSVRKVTGNRFECCGQWWYYQKIKEKGRKAYYSVTIPSHGVCVCEFKKLSDAKEWIADNFDKIVEKSSTDFWRREEQRFNELVEEARENERRSENS